MANSNTPYGLRPVGTIGNASYAGKIEKFFVPSTDATAIGLGDPVVLAGSADADGVPTVTRFSNYVASTSTASTVVGVMVGVVPVPTDLTLGYRKASTAQYVLVDTDPNTIYEVQETSTSATTYIAATSVAQNALLTAGTVDTTTGNGKTVLSTTVGATTNYDVQILRLSQEVDNSIGRYAKWLVRLNNNQYKANTTGL